MISPTEEARGTTTTHVEVFVVPQMPRPARGSVDAIPSRYAVTVMPIDSGDGRWWPHVQITDDSGNIVKSVNGTAVRFPTRADAEHAGWSFVEAWIRCRATTSP